MYLITNKHLLEQSAFSANGSQSTELANLRFANSNELSQSLRYCVLQEDGIHLQEIGSQAWMKALMQEQKYSDILFYIHGFSNQPYPHIIPTVKQLQNQLDAEQLSHVFVVPIIWPCDDDFGIIKDYWDDQQSAMDSGRYLSRAISKLMAWQQQQDKNLPCLKRMHILAHSMGARVLMNGLAVWGEQHGGVPYLFKNIFLMAADIPNEALGWQAQGYQMTQAAQRVLCYYAHDDLAMPASKIANVKNGVFSRRLGHTGPEKISNCPNNVYSINCDLFNNRFDPPKGHSYFLDRGADKNPVFEHMAQILKRKTVKLMDRELVL